MSTRQLGLRQAQVRRGGDGGATTLAQAYAAGLVVPTDDVFAMPSGNLRFIGSSDDHGVPGVAFYESSSTTGDQRYATWFTRRYLRVGIGVGETVAATLVGYDPLWDGLSVNPLNGTELVTNRVGYTNSSSENTADMVVLLGETGFTTTAGFFSGTDCYPTPGFNIGQVENFIVSLWQGATQANRTAFGMTGWGTLVPYTMPLAHGITSFLDARVDWGHMSPLAGDGTGIFWRRGTDDPPAAILEAHMLNDAGAAADYGVGIWVRDNVGGLTNPIVTFDWTNGIKFNGQPVFAWGTVAAGATAVSITNSPGVSATPVEYVAVKNSLGQTRYIALLA